MDQNGGQRQSLQVWHHVDLLGLASKRIPESTFQCQAETRSRAGDEPHLIPPAPGFGGVWRFSQDDAVHRW